MAFRSRNALGIAGVLVIHASAIALLWLSNQYEQLNTPVSLTLIKVVATHERKTEAQPPIELPPPSVFLPDIPVPAITLEMHTITTATTQASVSYETPMAADNLPSPITLESELAASCPTRSPPQYPASAKRLHEQGTVVLRAELNEQGNFANVMVVNSSGSPRLDDAARETVLRWKCNPAIRNGKAVRSVARQEFEFVLNRR